MCLIYVQLKQKTEAIPAAQSGLCWEAPLLLEASGKKNPWAVASSSGMLEDTAYKGDEHRRWGHSWNPTEVSCHWSSVFHTIYWAVTHGKTISDNGMWHHSCAVYMYCGRKRCQMVLHFSGERTWTKVVFSIFTTKNITIIAGDRDLKTKGKSLTVSSLPQESEGLVVQWWR